MKNWYLKCSIDKNNNVIIENRLLLWKISNDDVISDNFIETDKEFYID